MFALKRFLSLLFATHLILNFSACKTHSHSGSLGLVSTDAASASSEAPGIFLIQTNPSGLSLAGSEIINIIERRNPVDRAYAQHIERINAPHPQSIEPPKAKIEHEDLSHESKVSKSESEAGPSSGSSKQEKLVQKKDEFDDFHLDELKEGHIVVLSGDMNSRWFPRFTSEGRWELEEITDAEEKIQISDAIHAREPEVSLHFYKMKLVKKPAYNRHAPRNPHRDPSVFRTETKAIRDEIEQKKSTLPPFAINYQKNELFSTLVPDIMDTLEFYRGVLTPERYAFMSQELVKALEKGDGKITFLWYMSFQASITEHASASITRNIEFAGFDSPNAWLDASVRNPLDPFPTVIPRPAPMDLSIKQFNEFFNGTYETAPLGIHRNYFISADGLQMSPYVFWDHDVFHTDEIYTSIITSKDRKGNQAFYEQLHKKIQSTDEPLRTQLELIYFCFWHEDPKFLSTSSKVEEIDALGKEISSIEKVASHVEGKAIAEGTYAEALKTYISMAKELIHPQ